MSSDFQYLKIDSVDHAKVNKGDKEVLDTGGHQKGLWLIHLVKIWLITNKSLMKYKIY